MSGFAPRVKTKEIDLAEFDGEGILKVRGLNVNAVEKISELQQRLQKEGYTDENLINLKISKEMCKLCIVEAPFEINDDTIGDFPVGLIMKIAEIVGDMDNKFPLQ